MVKLKSIIFAPVPDEEGYQLMHCYHCGEYFLVNPKDIGNEYCCPYCSLIGGVMSFTATLRNRVTKDPALQMPVEKYKITEESFVTDEWIKAHSDELDEIDETETIDDLLEDLGIEDLEDDGDTEVISYNIDDVYPNPVFHSFEFICCEKTIKVPMEIVDKVHRCPFCYGEIIK